MSDASLAHLALHRTLHERILSSAGWSLPAGAAVLDFGCGKGAMVEEYRRAGYDAYGCDIAVARARDRIRPIDTDPYRLPFSDETFTYVFSDQVLEHVMDHDVALREIWRVLKPGGVSLHIFPPKLRPIEAHVRVPFASVIRSHTWLTLWAALGIRNGYQQGKHISEVVQLNSDYLREHTNYLTKRELQQALSRRFQQAVFAERFMIEHTYGSAGRLKLLVRWVPALARLYGEFGSRVVIASKGTVSDVEDGADGARLWH